MSAQGWARKISKERSVPVRREVDSRLSSRMRMLSRDELTLAIDNSLSKIGKLVQDGQRPGMGALLMDAEKESAALTQALQELSQRGEVAL